jgi:hypothetical protein
MTGACAEIRPDLPCGLNELRRVPSTVRLEGERCLDTLVRMLFWPVLLSGPCQ